MRKLLPLIYLLAVSLTSSKAQQLTGPLHENFTMRVVADKLSDPWEVTYGPDHYLWVTEARGYRVSRIDPATGSKTVLLDLNSDRNFPRYDLLPRGENHKPWPQGGLMGLALHPQLLTGQPYVYLAYVNYFEGANQPGNGCRVNYGGCFFKTKIVRFQYQASTQKLLNPVTLCDTIPNSSDHNSGRLLIAPVGNQNCLFYTVGDLGAGQFDNGGRANHAQDKAVYEGKVLRFNLSPDANTDSGNQWIPDDNPFNGNNRQNAVWSYGHRNAQGLAYGVVAGKGYIYSSEHGPYSDDEVNIIEKGKNYGHPLIIGYADGNYNGLAASVSDEKSLPGKWHTSYPLIVDEQANAKRIGAAEYRDPILSLSPNSHTELTELFNQLVSGGYSGWPSEAPSSIDVYTSSAIPGWQNSLLIPALKGHKLIRLKLNSAGNLTVGDTLCYFDANVRYRDLAISADGKKIYLATDSASISSGPSQRNPGNAQIKGAILEFTYIGMDNNKSQPANIPMRKETIIDEKRGKP